MTMDALTAEPTGGPLGALVEGVNLAEDQPGDVVYQTIRAFERYQLLIFRGQRLSAERQLEVAGWFGPTYVPPKGLPMLGGDDQPPIVAVSNVVEDGLLGSMEIPPHSDLQYMPVPLLASMLYAVEVPGRGGETSWANLHQAYDELDGESKAKLDGLKVWALNPYTGGFAKAKIIGEGQKYVEEEVPRFAHPLVRTHPATGRKSLFVSVLSAGIIGLDDDDEARDLLRRLKAHVDQPHLYYVHAWQPGDVVVWDNRCTNHKRASFDDGERRVMYRAQIAGSRPF